MVAKLSEVIEEVSKKISLFETVSDLDNFLKEAIVRIKDGIGAGMAAVFIHDAATQDLVFRAGIDPDGVWDRCCCEQCENGKTPPRFSLNGNDVGLAFQEGRILKRSYPPGDSDHPFRSKLLVPISRGPLKIGVLILADTHEHAFPDPDDAEILSATAHLGDILEEASVLIEARENTDHFRIIFGQKACEGIARGTALPFWADMESAAKNLTPSGTTSEELDRFDQALNHSQQQLEDMQNKAASGVSEMGALIFMAHLLMLKDKSFTAAMRSRIEAGTAAATAIQGVVNEYAVRFSKMPEVRLAEKAQDVRDLGYRLITNLDDAENQGFSYKGRIALARHIYPSDLFRLSVEGISGVVLFGTGVTAHISILARSLDLPVLITADKSLLDISEGTLLLLHATNGKLFVDPPDAILKEYEQLLKAFQPGPDFFTLKGRTADHVDVQVLANVNILKDAEEAKTQGAEGIGLYRSEFPFILKNDFLSEEQQYHIYRSITLSQAGKSVILRTADIGGDKILQGREKSEDNPFLGVRGIRFSLAHREMFREQLRAMLRAGVDAKLGIMLPMVSGVEEVLEAKEEIAQAIESLKQRRVPHNPHPRIGAMVELPSAALAVSELATETDFLSIGTNDLTMYLLAVDRTNENLSHLYRSHHPTVLSILAQIVRDSGSLSSEVSVCGDAAADPVLVPFFVGIGIRKLSVPPALVESVKKRLSQFTVDQAQAIAGEMLSIKRISDMEQYLNSFDQHYPPPR